MTLSPPCLFWLCVYMKIVWSLLYVPLQSSNPYTMMELIQIFPLLLFLKFWSVHTPPPPPPVIVLDYLSYSFDLWLVDPHPLHKRVATSPRYHNHTSTPASSRWMCSYTVIRGQHVLKKPFSSFIDFTRHAGSKLCHMEWKINTAVSAVCNNQHCTRLYQTIWCQRVYFSIYYSISTVPDYLVSEGLKYLSIYYLFQLWAIRLINIAYTYKF